MLLRVTFVSGDTEWRWADPQGQQRLVRTDELLAALASGVIAPNTPVWRSGWKAWKPAYEVPELTSSALASANGIVPNIPPPPLFMVAVQHDYEDKSGPQTRAAPGPEPPPPPSYVPLAVPEHTRATASVVAQPPAPAAHPAPPPPEADPPALPRAEPTPKPSVTERHHRPPANVMSFVAPPVAGAQTLAQPATMAGLGALPFATAEREATAPKKPSPRSSLPDDAGWEMGSAGAAAPHHMDLEAKTVVDRVALSPTPDPRSLAPVGPSHPTVHGIPSLAEPVLPPPPPLRPSSVPTNAGAGGMALSPSYAPRATSPSPGPPPVVGSRPPPPLRKRPTLLLYGGAPQDAPAGEPKGEGDHPSINVPAPGAQAPKAVTQAPPWSEDSARFDPTIPRSAPSNLPPMRPIADSIEEITGSVLLDEGGPGNAQDAQKIEALSASFVIPDGFDEAAAPPDAKAAGAADEKDLAPPPELSPAIPSPSPSRRILHDLSEIWNEPQKRWMLAVGAAGALVLAVGMLGLVVRLFSGPPSETVHEAPAAALPPPPVAPSTAPTQAEPAQAPSAPAPVAEPVATATSSAPCAIAGAAHVIAPKAQIRIGVEALASQNRLALGFVTGDKDGFAALLESTSLATLGSAKQHSHESIRRVVPLAGPGKTVAIVADVERKTDKIAGARTVAGSGSFVLGSADGKLVWGTNANDSPHPLWPLENDGPAEAIRAVALEGGGYALAFRQGAAVYLGALSPDKTPNGNLVRVAGLGPQIGSPALGASGKTIMMAWADRAAATDPWGMRLLEWNRGEAPGGPHAFSIPAGGLGEQAMSPGLAGLSGGRFLIAWTEGPVASHQVRAETIGASGDALGPPLTISADGVNAGQGQVALLPDGKGLVVYMTSPAGSTAAVVATPVACPSGPM
jgi:hypothetical protein